MSSKEEATELKKLAKRSVYTIGKDDDKVYSFTLSSLIHKLTWLDIIVFTYTGTMTLFNKIAFKLKARPPPKNLTLVLRNNDDLVQTVTIYNLSNCFESDEDLLSTLEEI